MKSKTSLFNKAVFKHNLTGCFGLWAGLTVLYLLLLPVSIYSIMTQAARYTEPESLTDLYILNMTHWIWNMEVFVIIFAWAALVTAMFLFSYLFTARNSNMMHTYPVNRMSLFTTNYISGLLFLLVPLLVSAILALLVGAVHGAATGEVVKCYFIWMGTVMIENIFFFSLSVCVLMFVGNIIAVPVLYLILNFLYMGIMVTIEWMVDAVSYGIETFTISTPLGRILTPMYYLSKLHLYIETKENGTIEYSSNAALSLFIYLAAAIVFTVIALIAYRKKHIETAGDVITVNWLKPIFRWGVAVCTSSVGALVISSFLFEESFGVILFSAAVIGIIVFFIAQMLLDKNVHVFTKKRIRECLIYTVLICLVYIGLDADVLGMEKKIPEASEVKAVLMSGGIDLYAEDAEEISWAENIHKQIIDSKKEFERRDRGRENGVYAYEYVSFDYRMKDDSRLRRTYRIPAGNILEGSVQEQIQEYASRPNVILKQYFGIHYPEIEVYGGIWQDESENYNTRISEADAKRFYQAVTEDVKAGRLSVRQDEDTVYYGYLNLDVRDEAGFITPLNALNTIRQDKEGTAEINVDSRFTCLVKEMKKLGYIQNDENAREK